MKKVLSTLLVVAMALSLTACGGGSSNSSSSSSNSSSSSSGSAASSGTASTGYTGGTYNIGLGHICSETHSLNLASLEFQKYVEEQSGGAITVDIYPNGVLGGDEAMLESVALGTLTMVAPSASVMNVYEPAFGILAMPYLFTSTDDAFAAVDGDLGQLLNQKLADANVGILNLGYNFNGIRNMTNNIRPIVTPDDLKGLKMRCMSNEMFVTMFNLMGANATPMSWSELFTALQQGTVDGQENPASLMYESKFQEVQKYLSTTEHIYDFCTININADFYNNLDDQAKAIIDEGVKTYLVDYQRQLEVSQNEEYIQKLADEGMEVTYVTPENKAKFAELVAPMYDNAAEQFGQDVMDAVAQYR
ncbi:MAG: TRAP transporter substrate-binding protein [Lawsonibacter sp.]